MRKSGLAILAAACALLSVPANAASYVFSYASISGPLEQASGTFSTGSNNAVTAIAGSVTYAGGTFSITGLSNYASATNIFSPTQPYFNFGGLSFAAQNGVTFNLYSNNGSYIVTDSTFDPTGGSPISSDAVVTLSVTPVPEPATWALFIGGFGLAGAAMRRRNVRVSLV